MQKAEGRRQKTERTTLFMRSILFLWCLLAAGADSSAKGTSTLVGMAVRAFTGTQLTSCAQAPPPANIQIYL